jgi:hypothetical protein
MARPIAYVKAHPTATVVAFLGGMVFGPWTLSFLRGATGFGVRVPQYGSDGG